MNLKRSLVVLKQKIIEPSKHLVLPLFEGLTLYDVSRFFLRGIYEGRITDRAASIAFSFFLALFPGVIFLFSLLPFFEVPGLEVELFATFERVLPPDTYDAVRETINEILHDKKTGLLSLGFFLALIFATNGVNALINNFNSTVHQIGNQKFL